jgi:urease accessory protein
LAHLDPVAHGSLMAGLSHPVFGLDHILAMVAVGLWAAMLGGRAVWAVPSAFAGAMVAGFGLAAAGLALPLVEPVILASVVALGLVVAMAARLPAGAGALMVGAFGIFHGYAHGGEIGGAGAMPYVLGFVVATGLLHAVGVGVGLAIGAGSQVRRLAVRSLGAGTSALGFGLVAGMI